VHDRSCTLPIVRVQAFRRCRVFAYAVTPAAAR
jgi:hypothetical protein